MNKPNTLWERLMRSLNRFFRNYERNLLRFTVGLTFTLHILEIVKPLIAKLPFLLTGDSNLHG